MKRTSALNDAVQGILSLLYSDFRLDTPTPANLATLLRWRASYWPKNSLRYSYPLSLYNVT